MHFLASWTEQRTKPSAMIFSFIMACLLVITTSDQLSSTAPSRTNKSGSLRHLHNEIACAAFLSSPIALRRRMPRCDVNVAAGGKSRGGALGMLPASAEGVTSNTKRRHLGPTSEDMVSLRRAEREQRREKVAAVWAQSADCQQGAEDADLAQVDERTARTPSVGSGKRHLGPTLDEIAMMRSQAVVPAPVSSTASVRSTQPESTEAKANVVPLHDAPTQVQLIALRKQGVEEDLLPLTKSEASEMLRAIREIRLGNDLTASNGKQSGTSEDAMQAQYAETEADNRHEELAQDVMNEYTRATTKEDVHGDKAWGHLQFALNGISAIRREGAFTSVVQKQAQA